MNNRFVGVFVGVAVGTLFWYIFVRILCLLFHLPTGIALVCAGIAVIIGTFGMCIGTTGDHR